MSFKITIDKRERPGKCRSLSLLSHYGEKHGDDDWTVKPIFSKYITFENLDCGDICFFKDDKPVILIERKDIKDLASCIKNKSYKEQKTRMLKFQSQNLGLKLVYLIENYSISTLSELDHVVNPEAPISQKITKKVIMSTIVSTLFRDGFLVMITQGIEGTIAFLDRIYAKYPTYKLDSNVNLSAEDGKHEYLKQIKIKKQKNIDSNAWFLFALAQIPTVSVDKAKVIQQHYKSMPMLIDKFREQNSDKDRERLLTSIPGIGKVLAKRVYEYVMVPKIPFKE